MKKDKTPEKEKEARMTDKGSKVDVSQIQLDELKPAEFPASAAREYRVVLSRHALAAVSEHANADRTVEQCGFLAGKVLKDKSGAYLLVEQAIPGVGTRRTGSQVTFTHETWDHVHKVIEEKFPDHQIVGWYHSHPALGVFLSDMDQFIQDNFFNAPHSVALVYDPCADVRAVFHWRNGKSERLRRYWVGDELVYDLEPAEVAVKPAQTKREEERDEDERDRRRRTDYAEAEGEGEPRLKIVWTFVVVVGLICAFAVGWVLAERRSAAELSRIQQIALQAVDASLRENRTSLENFVRSGLFRWGLSADIESLADRLGQVKAQTANARELITQNLVAKPGVSGHPDAELKALDEVDRQVGRMTDQVRNIFRQYATAEVLALQLKQLNTYAQDISRLDRAQQKEQETLARLCVEQARLLLAKPAPPGAADAARRLRQLALDVAPHLEKEIDQALPDLAPPKPKPTTPPASGTTPPR